MRRILIIPCLGLTPRALAAAMSKRIDPKLGPWEVVAAGDDNIERILLDQVVESWAGTNGCASVVAFAKVQDAIWYVHQLGEVVVFHTPPHGLDERGQEVVDLQGRVIVGYNTKHKRDVVRGFRWESVEA